MSELSDAELLRDYAERRNEAAFRELVTRHADLVYSAALRQVESPDLAGDVAQTVFTDLARKARAVAGQLAEGASLVGWLYRSTRFAALGQLRADRRRLTHERQAMEQLLTNSETAPDWERIRPMLDEAMASLGDEDRDAVLLRYFKRQEFRAVGGALGISDDAAQKRVSRAVERLREFFVQRGVALTGAAIAGAVSANAVQAVPVGLAWRIGNAALAAAGVGTSFTAGLLRTLLSAKAQVSLVAAVVLAVVAWPWIVSQFQKQPVNPNPSAATDLAQETSDAAPNMLPPFVEAARSASAANSPEGFVNGEDSDGKTFTVEGIVTLEASEQPVSATNRANREVPFKVQVAGAMWRIDLPQCEQHPDDSYHYSFDGKLAYRLFSFPAAIEKKRRAGESVAGNIATAHVGKMQIPRDMPVLEASLLWLTYCSEGLFSNAVPGQFAPIFGYGGGFEIFDDKPAQPLATFWSLAEGDLHLPSSLASVLALPREVVEGLRQSGTGHVDASFTNVVFSVDSVADVGRLAVPNRATATLFGLSPAALFGASPAAKPIPMVVLRAIAIRISAGTTLDLSKPPELPGPTFIADMRSGAIAQFANRTNWVSESETKSFITQHPEKVIPIHDPSPPATLPLY